MSIQAAIDAVKWHREFFGEGPLEVEISVAIAAYRKAARAEQRKMSELRDQRRRAIMRAPFAEAGQ